MMHLHLFKPPTTLGLDILAFTLVFTWAINGGNRGSSDLEWYDSWDSKNWDLWVERPVKFKKKTIFQEKKHFFEVISRC